MGRQISAEVKANLLGCLMTSRSEHTINASYNNDACRAVKFYVSDPLVFVN